MKNTSHIYLLSQYGYGYGYGSGYGNGYGSGYGNGYGDGNGNGYGSGYGNGYGDGNGSGNGDGNGNGSGYGYGDGNGNGDGSGYGNGNGYGSGYGNGDGNGNGSGIYFAKLFGEWFEISNGVENSLCNNLPPHLYDKINAEFIKQIDNLESLRILRDKLGLKKYLSFFDAKIINEEMDDQGNQMRLYKYDEKGEKTLLLEVICPSTKFMYHLHPPNQKATTCKEAKASTFSNKSLSYRQGDVGLMNLKDLAISIPLSET